MSHVSRPRGQRKVVERLWREFFSDPSQWWDHRGEKANPKYPDFKHKKIQVSLWLNSKSNPLWVEAKLAALAPGSIQQASISLNKRIASYVRSQKYEKTLELFHQMQQEIRNPDKFTFVSVLNACCSLQALEEGRRAHVEIIKCGFETDPYVSRALVDMYVKCNSIEDACIVFNKMPTKDVGAWSSMILGYAKCGQGWKALELWQLMNKEEVEPNPVTFVGVLNACASVAAIAEGQLVHEEIIQRGFESNIYVGSSLLDMYAKCGSIVEAWRVFNKMPKHDVVSWNAMIQGLVKCGQGQKALDLSQQMHDEGVELDSTTFVAVLNACASIGALEEGRLVHEKIIGKGLEFDAHVGSSLVDMFAKCGSIEEAFRVFIKLPTRNVVAWNAMILGYVNCGQGHRALDISQQMQSEGVGPDNVTFLGMLNACALVSSLKRGRHVHELINQSNHQHDVSVGNSLVDMYANCGSIEDALAVFMKMVTHDVVSWNVILGGYAMHGYGMEALQLFERMCQESLDMNEVTFVSLLSACSHVGLVDEGLHFFQSMSAVYNVAATVEHYTCMIDLLGRAGRLHEASDLMRAILGVPNVSGLIALLSACRVHNNVDIADQVAKQVLDLDLEESGGYVLLTNIYVAAGKWNNSARIPQWRMNMLVKESGS